MRESSSSRGVARRGFLSRMVQLILENKQNRLCSFSASELYCRLRFF